MNTTDFSIINDGSIVLLFANTITAKEWVTEHLQLDQWQNPYRVAIEPRYLDDIIEGITEVGMTIDNV